ncbi:hypothetical protein ACM41_06220 [Bradyrhizobium sp. CCBAU 21362]|uniref:hypothetical protein n=1 Tax=Bradyrhizobium sp. CCBAU 21362 TaxID=1325082 RepID=UPI00230517D4|nr:hypothetical protein [Bradyrhizobium sp. CCBAU 21362]MDA9535872.1 hypothetical protein [Bradyrhizobium sp. CCBAU 21362]
MKHLLFFAFLAAISIGVSTDAAAQTPGEFVKQVVLDMNREDPSLESRVLEPKLLAAYKRALEINEKKSCVELPSLGGYLNQQDGRELQSVKVIAAGPKSARVRVGFGPLNSSNDSIFFLQRAKDAWQIVDLRGVKENDGFRAEYLNWRCPTVH